MSFVTSHSKIEKFEACPRLYEGLHVKGIKTTQSEQSLWGDRVHKTLELAVTESAPLPEDTKHHEWALAPARKAMEVGAEVKAEWKLAITKQLQPCDFWASNVWIRGKADLALLGIKVANVWDYKTGKRTSDTSQLQLMSAFVFLHKPAIEFVQARYLWMQEKKASGISLTRADFGGVMSAITARVNRIERAHETGVFIPIPHWRCKKHCPVKTCEHNGQK